MTEAASLPAARALIAEDEPILAGALRALLKKVWPQLEIVALAGNGVQAVEMALAHKPDLLFLDIKMPGKSGMDAAQELAEDWPADSPFPLVCFVTAYDEYAARAFELSATDYLLKPVNEARLQKAVQKLVRHLPQVAAPQNAPPAIGLADPALQQLVQSLQAFLPPMPSSAGTEQLRFIRAAIGNQVKMIPVAEVVYFEATDKYVNVVCADAQALIRTSLRELAAQLDAQQFWQIHRGTIVNADCIAAAQRDEFGKLSLKLKQRKELLRVSPLYAHLFKQM
ncbi:LytTR family DNA-binding domain-containing protein [Massilia sp. W12]|uniref:LytR/AlgR family response regulator transcription factor n=1 Tax=Massilia sp. W12 TaxID=3126507 RepID=UPI0030D38A76